MTRITIPTLAFRAGDFRTSPTIIYDPLTGDAQGRGRQQIQCNGVLNVICPARISAIAQRILGFLPPPTFIGFTNNYEEATTRIKDTESFDVKVDHKIGDNDSFFVRYSFQRPKVFDPGLYGSMAGPKPVDLREPESIARRPARSTTRTFSRRPLSLSFAWASAAIATTPKMKT